MSMKRIPVFVGLICLLTLGCDLAPPAVDQGPPELIPREVLFGNPDRAGVRLSPDGSKLSYLAPLEGVLNVWVGPREDPSAAQPVTQDRHRGIRVYFWAFTAQHVIYLQDKDGDENWRAYSVNVETGVEKTLSPVGEVRAQIMEVSHKSPGEILLGLNDRDPRFFDVYRVDIATGERTLLEKNDEFAGFLTDDDFNVRFAARTTPDGGQDLLAKQADGSWGEFMRIDMEDVLTTQPLGFNKTGDVLYLIDSRNRNTAALFAHDLDTGEQTVLYEDPRADVDDGMIHPTEKTVQAAASTYDRRQWKILDDAIKEDMDYLATVADGDFEVIDRTLADNRWIVAYELSDQPLRYYLYNRSEREASFLFSNRQQLETHTLAKMHSAIINSRDGLDLVSYLTLPAEADADGDARPADPLPMVLFVHGGPWARDFWGYHSYHQWLANRGYAVLSVNYRGSTGFGKEFVNASIREWGDTMHDDLIDAVNWAVDEGIAAAGRVAIMGGSYGGYATLAGVTFTPEAFACGVDIVGPSNLVTLLESVPEYWKPALEIFTTRVGDHRTEEGRAFLTERSPLTYADQIQVPLLIGQGANDPRVKQQESDQIVDAMQSKSIPVTYVLYPDEGHGFARPENRGSFNAVAEAFLSACLEGRAEPIGDDFEGSSITVPAGAEYVQGLEEALAQSEEGAGGVEEARSIPGAG